MKKGKGKIILLEIIMILASLIIIFPVLIMVLGSFKSSPEAAQFSVALPSEWHFENYAHVFKKGKVARAMLNSFFISGVAVTSCIIFASMTAFILARRTGKMVDRVYNLFMMGMIAPISIIPTIAVFQFLKISGSYFSVIMLYIAVNIPWSVFIFTQFIKGVDREIDDAAIVDGCGITRLFFTIILPLLKPVTITNIVIIAMAVWNDFMIPLYFFGSSKKWTMPLTVYNFFGLYSRDWNYVFADLMLTALPIAIIYFLCQKHIVSGMTAGAVKG